MSYGVCSCLSLQCVHMDVSNVYDCVYMYMHACMCTCVYMYMHVYVFIIMYMHVHAGMHVCSSGMQDNRN